MSEINKTNTGKMDVGQDLQLALQRRLNEEEYQVIPQVDHVLNLACQKEELLATQILAEKERQWHVNDPGISIEDEVYHLQNCVLGQKKALYNHKIIKDAAQTAVISAQVQESLKTVMAGEVKDIVHKYPEAELLLSHCSNNLITCKDLVSVVNRKNHLDMEILRLQKQYSSLLSSIREKWEHLETGLYRAEEGSELVQLQKKMNGKEGRVQILVTMIQGLVSSCGFAWGAVEYYIQLMCLCRAVLRNANTSEQNKIMQEITRIHKVEHKKKSGLRQTRITDSNIKITGTKSKNQ